MGVFDHEPAAPGADVLCRARAAVRDALARQGKTVADIQDDLAEQRRAEAS